jgi:N-acetylneuraminic acid mutarotase
MKKILTPIFISLTVPFFAQGLWTPKTAFPAGGRSAANGFTVGTAAYVCCGIDSSGYKRSNWLYNPATDAWTQVLSLGGVTGSGLSRDVAMSFQGLGNTVYVVGGQGSIAYFNDAWRYDGGLDTWTQVPNFSGGGRRSGVGFSVNGKGYVALGQASTGLKNDCWEYNFTANTWTQKANYPGTARRLSVAFVINTLAYIGTGDDGICKGDFYAYDAVLNTWTPRASFGGTPRYGATGFAMNGKGYVGFGYDNTLANRKDFWQYDPVANSWSAMSNFPGTARSNAVAVVCSNNKAYMGLGYDSLYRDDWWEFDPTLSAVNENEFGSAISIFPNPVHDISTIRIEAGWITTGETITISVFDLNGKMVRTEKQETNGTIGFPRGDLAAGMYILSLSSGSHGCVTKRIIVE